MKNNKEGKKNILKKLCVWIIGILIIQYFLGMTSNLFVTFPTSGTQTQLWEFAWHQVPVTLHIVVGTLLLVLSVIILIVAINNKMKKRTISGIVGLLSIFIAGFSGAQFVSSQNNIYSFIMSIFFIIALVSYTLVIGS
ncbi:MAG: hypothetical protein ABSC49_00085 [Candidatus Microgenomates bacterium]|jgi:hypothetical protein